jgi:hypothetical protein
MNETKQGWEPSAYIADKFCQAYFGKGWKAIAPNDTVRQEYYKDVKNGLRSAIAADPLLSAAGDLRDALADITQLLERIGDGRKDAPFINAANAALVKSRGEG